MIKLPTRQVVAKSPSAFFPEQRAGGRGELIELNTPAVDGYCKANASPTVCGPQGRRAGIPKMFLSARNSVTGKLASMASVGG